MGATASKHCCIDLSMLLLFLYEQKNCRREGIISPPARPCPNAFEKEVLHKKRSSKNLPLNFWNPIFCFLFRPHFTSFGMWKMLGVLNHTADADSDSKAAEPGWCFCHFHFQSETRSEKEKFRNHNGSLIWADSAITSSAAAASSAAL